MSRDLRLAAGRVGVKRSLYEEIRERMTIGLALERRLRDLLYRIAWITPRPGHWAYGWRLVQNEARQLLSGVERQLSSPVA